MPEMNAYMPGTPCWVDVSSDNAAASAGFYSSLFGWDAMEVPDGGGYTMLLQDGKAVAAAGVNQSGGPAAWSTYIATDDADATAAKITAAGGSLIVDVMDIFDAGRMAFALDPQGALFGIWESGTHKGAQIVNEPFAYTWAELNTTDADAAQAFYSTVFGWEPEALEGARASTTPCRRSTAGSSAASWRWRGCPPAWGVYFAVEDTDATIAKAEKLGGSTLRPAADTDFGRMAILADPDGAVFAVIALAGAGEAVAASHGRPHAGPGALFVAGGELLGAHHRRLDRVQQRCADACDLELPDRGDRRPAG